MKKIKYLLGTLIILSFIFSLSSCEPNSSVQITIDNPSIIASPGDTIYIVYSLTPDALEKGELGDLTILNTVDSTELRTQNYTGTISITDSLEFIVSPDAIEGSIITLTFSVIDTKSGLETKEYCQITVELGYPTIFTANDIQANYISTSLDNNMIFNLEETEVTMEDGNFSDGELAFVWQNEYGYSIVSPNSSWITTLYGSQTPVIIYTTDDKQETQIMVYSGSWADLTQKDIDGLEITPESITGGGIGVQKLAEGDIIVFETEDGRKGALLVKTNAKASKYLIADLKYQTVAGTASK